MPMNLLKGKTKCLDILERSFIVFGFVDTYKLGLSPVSFNVTIFATKKQRSAPILGTQIYIRAQFANCFHDINVTIRYIPNHYPT